MGKFSKWFVCVLAVLCVCLCVGCFDKGGSGNDGIVGVWMMNGKPECEFTKDGRFSVLDDNGKPYGYFNYKLEGENVSVLSDEFEGSYTFENGIVYTYVYETEGDDGKKVKLTKKN